MDKKKKILLGVGLVLIVIFTSSITALASTYLYTANQVGYDNTQSQIKDSEGHDIDNVKGAIDELYAEAVNYSTINSYLDNIIVVQSYDKKDITITSAHSYSSTSDINITKTGYTPLIATCGVTTAASSGANGNAISVARCRVTNDKTGIDYAFFNHYSATAKVDIKVNVLYVKNK